MQFQWIRYSRELRSFSMNTDARTTDTPKQAKNGWLVRLLRDAWNTSWALFKIMLPISILTKVLQDCGVIEIIGRGLGPVMECVGLPGSMGLVWASSMMTNIYGGVVVFAALVPTHPLTVAQVTVLGTMVLVAHALPVELRIAQKAGTRFRIMLLIRVLGAVLLGLILNTLYTRTGWLQQPAEALWTLTAPDRAWGAWAANELRNYAMIFAIILALLLLLRILDAVGVISFLTRMLNPVLVRLGIGRAAAPLTMIGMTMGITYGGGLIIQEAQSGRISSRDVFFSLALLGLAHSVIEDTLLMVALGAHVSGLLWGRVLFALLVVAAMVRVLSRVSDEVFNRWFVRPPKPTGDMKQKTDDGVSRCCQG